MIRSNRHVFVSFCLLNQGVRATGIVKHYPAVVSPVIEILTKEKINIFQMMCPELIFDGFHRRPCGKKKYDTPENRKTCIKIAKSSAWLMELLVRNGHKIDVVIGIDFSPSCAVDCISGSGPGRFQKGKGIYIEELQKIMNQKGIKIPFLGVQVYHMRETLERLRAIIGGTYERI